MTLKPEMLASLACPQCRGGLSLGDEGLLLCPRCVLGYPVVDGVPQLRISEARAIGANGQVAPRYMVAILNVEDGPDTGKSCQLSRGTCVALGRLLDDAHSTQIFNVDFTMSLDDTTKKLVGSYLARTSGKKTSAPAVSREAGDLSGYQRLPDLVLKDAAVSRLHAMIFHDDNGLGVLDLISRNGTFVNGREVEATLLKNGDEVMLGATRIRITLN